MNLDDANLVCNIKSIVVPSQANIGFLLSVRSYQQINFCYFDIIKFTDSSSHMVFVCTQMCQEHQGVVVFDFLHGGFSSQWIFDDVEWVHAISGWHRLAGVSWIPWQSQCLWTTECNTGTHFACTCSEWTFDHLLLHFTCMNNSGGGLLVLGGYSCF